VAMVLASCASCATTRQPPDDRPRVEDIVIEGDEAGMAMAQLRTLAALGFGIDVSGLRLTTRPIAEIATVYEERIARMWTPRQTHALRGLARLFAGDAVMQQVTHDSLVKAIAQVTLGGMAAYYDYEGREIVILEGTGRENVRLEDVLLHELVHVYQDQQIEGGLRSLFAGESLTLEEIRIAQLVTEGHAQLVMHAARLHERGRSLEDLHPDDLTMNAARLTAGDWVLIYDVGTRAVLERHRAEGWRGVEKLLSTRPTSSEQLLHPQKLGRDLPTHVPPPEVAEARLEWHTVVGELSIFLLFTSHGVSDDEAFLASQGWDGDCLAAYTWRGESLVVWRTLWDRPEDAVQFLSRLRAMPNRSASAWLEQSDNTVDIVMGPNAERLVEAGRIARALPALPVPPARDGVASAREEATYQARLAASVVVEPGFATIAGVRIPVPDGWQVRRLKGITFIADAVRDGFTDNITVHVESDSLGSLDAFEQRLRHNLAAARLEVIDFRRVAIGHAKAAVYEVRGTWPGQTHLLRQLGVTTLRDGKLITVAASVLESRWPEREAMLRALLERLEWTSATP
jgi:hypothetical protein